MTLKSVLYPDNEPELNEGRVIFYGVVDGMAPFNPGKISMWYAYDIDYHRYVIHVQTQTLPQNVFVLKVPGDKFITASTPQAVFEEIGLAACSYFRNLYQPPEANIILGEE